MGVFSFGAVAMGIVNLSIVGMGIISSGITTMGVWEYSPRNISSGHQHNSLSEDINSQLNKRMLFKNKEEAEKMAKKINCKGVHRMGNLWMPCNSH